MKKILILVSSFVLALCLVGCSKNSSSVAIIGGADGPTEIFVASGMRWMSICGLIGIIVAVVLVVFIICRIKKNK